MRPIISRLTNYTTTTYDHTKA